MESLDIKTYVSMAKRRVYWIIIPFLIVLLGGLAFALRVEPVYESSTMILVQPQEVPRDFVRPIVENGIQERLRTISQQVTSRTNLESIIAQHGLYQNSGLLLETQVQTLRSNIRVNVGGTGRGGRGESTFTISFRHRDPETARAVTSTLASNFISENLKVRESQALGTSSFLAGELEGVRRRLEQREAALKEYRERHFGAMPEQLQTNLSMLMRMQSHLESLQKSFQDAQNRKILLQEQIAQHKRMEEQLAEIARSQSFPDAPDGTIPPEVARLAALRAKLEDLQSRYTESHPDVRRMKSTIERLETREAGDSTASASVGEAGAGAAVSDVESLRSKLTPPPWANLVLQVNQIDYEIGRILADIENTKERVEMYQKRVEEAPRREQEIMELKRDYENLRGLHNSLLNRKLEAEIAVSMERKQKGEQFRILDPARRSEIPVEPDMRRILLVTLALALGLGGGAAYAREIMDTSYKEPKETVEDLGLPVLISLPFRYTLQEERALKRKAWFKAFGVAVGFVILAAGIVVFTKGLDRTVEFVMRNLPFLGST